MASPLVTSLVVCGLGMLMLSVAMGLLYGLMYGMTALIRDRPEVKERRSGLGAEQEGGGARRGKREAAVIAAALARAEEEMDAVGAHRHGGAVSAWWTFHRQRHLNRDRRARDM